MLLMSLTKKDFRVDTYRGTGPGGQKVNKTSSCVRITHTASGVSSSCCTHREQSKNKAEAFRKLSKDKRFLAWVEGTARGMQQAVEESMSDENLLIEGKTETGWERIA